MKFLLMTALAGLSMFSPDLAFAKMPPLGELSAFNENADSCAATAIYDGDRSSVFEIQFELPEDSSPLLVIRNNDWNTETDEKLLGFRYTVNGHTYSDSTDENRGQRQITIRWFEVLVPSSFRPIIIYNSYMAILPQSFIEHLLSSDSLLVERNDRIIALFNLSSSSSEAETFKACVRRLKNEN